jgi:nucleotide-binding universal stress UspA family protein
MPCQDGGAEVLDMDESQIVVGIDGSTQSLHALDWAAQEATARGVGLTLVSAYTLPALYAPMLDGGYPGLDDTAIRAGAEQILATAAARVPSSGPDVKTRLVVEDAAGSLVEASREAGLVVVGTRGRGGFAGRLLGTVSSALPAHAACPTVVVPLRQGRQEATAPPRRIVVGVDGSPSSQVALHQAVDEARLWQADLVAVAAVPIARAAGVLSWLPTAVDTEQILREQETIVTAQVEQVAGDLDVRCVVLDGTGAELLTKFSADADLVVVGSRGRGGFAGLLLGSTSQAVLHHSACAVMVVNDRGVG